MSTAYSIEKPWNACADGWDVDEAESIVLARQLSADFLVLDDAAARRAAKTEGARVIGLLGLLVHARERGTIAELKPLLSELKASGFYIGESLYQALLRRVGEA
jgi:predicted nucleic acid-binding protein